MTAPIPPLGIEGWLVDGRRLITFDHTGHVRRADALAIAVDRFFNANDEPIAAPAGTYWVEFAAPLAAYAWLVGERLRLRIHETERWLLPAEPAASTAQALVATTRHAVVVLATNWLAQPRPGTAWPALRRRLMQTLARYQRGALTLEQMQARQRTQVALTWPALMRSLQHLHARQRTHEAQLWQQLNQLARREIVFTRPFQVKRLWSPRRDGFKIDYLADRTRRHEPAYWHQLTLQVARHRNFRAARGLTAITPGEPARYARYAAATPVKAATPASPTGHADPTSP